MKTADSEVIIRPYEPKDREAVRLICKKTGQKGNPTRIFFEDEELTPLLAADYYLDYEPESCFVAVVGGRIVGYQIGCKDTRRQQKILRTRIYPRLCLRILWKIITFQYRQKQTYNTLWWIVTSSGRESFDLPVDDYPGHTHFNVLPEYRNLGMGKKLNAAFRNHVLSHGVTGLHVIVRENGKDNRVSNYLLKEMGYRLLAEKKNTVWEKATGETWHARLLVVDLRPLLEARSHENSRA